MILLRTSEREVGWNCLINSRKGGSDNSEKNGGEYFQCGGGSTESCDVIVKMVLEKWGYRL